ncbi:MAG: sensor histidine kinase [Lysobacter sp.]
MSRPARRLQHRLMLAFAGFALLAVALFGLYTVAFMYSVEDAFLDTVLDHEVAAQLHQHAESGHWAEPRDPSMKIYTDTASFPEDLKALYATEPRRREYPGRNGRYYHLKEIAPPAPASRAWLVAEVSTQLVVRPMRYEVFVLLAGSGLLIIAMALLIGYWLARRTTGPLSRLATLVDGMSPDRLPRDFAHGFRDDEVGILARGLDALIGRVQALIAREQEFTRDASHELRTPLAVIRGAIERLMVEEKLSAAGKQHLGHVRQSALQLEQTVATLLSLAREDQPAAAGDPVQIVPILERVIVEQAPLLEGKAVDVEVAVPRGTCLALPAPVVHILLSNLIGNAFAHTDAGEVRIDVDGDRLRIANTGDGTDPALRWQLHQPFSKREGSDGFGLGLAIVRRLCDRYAIDLRIESVEDKAIASIAMDASAPRREATT